jgi:CubicO group peptidase (beta-lactamase class C family)
MESFAAQPLRFVPGSQQEYSNAGYVLLGRIVEVVSGASYADYVARYVYQPAGMHDTGFEPVPPAGGSVARGYVALGADGRPLMPRPNAGAPQRGMRGPPAAASSSSETPLPPLGVNSDANLAIRPAADIRPRIFSPSRALISVSPRPGDDRAAPLRNVCAARRARPARGDRQRTPVRGERRRSTRHQRGIPIRARGSYAVVVLSNYSLSATAVLQRVLSLSAR